MRLLKGLTAVPDRPSAAMYDDASGEPAMCPLVTELSARVVLLGVNLNSHGLQNASPLARLIAGLGCSWPSRTARRPSSTEPWNWSHFTRGCEPGNAQELCSAKAYRARSSCQARESLA